MSRGVSIKYQCEFLEPAKLQEWLFDNVGEPNTRMSDGSMIAADHERGWYFTFNGSVQVLRIALWTEKTVEQAWKEIDAMAGKLAKAIPCNLQVWAHDLHEYDEQAKGIVCTYDTRVSGEVVRTPERTAQGTMKEKAVRWN